MYPEKDKETKHYTYLCFVEMDRTISCNLLWMLFPCACLVMPRFDSSMGSLVEATGIGIVYKSWLELVFYRSHDDVMHNAVAHECLVDVTQLRVVQIERTVFAVTVCLPY